MLPAPYQRLIDARFNWFLSLFLHFGVWAVVVSAGLESAPGQRTSQPVLVDLFAARPNPVRPPAPAPASPAGDLARLQPEIPDPQETRPTTRNRPAEERNWQTASAFYAASVLRNPEAAQARQALKTLSTEDRDEQICALEAMEQLARSEPGFRPTRTAPHAFRPSYRKDGWVVVPAGAIRSRGNWYRLSYRCQLNAEASGVAAFEFALGDPIARVLWDEHGLAEVH